MRCSLNLLEQELAPLMRTGRFKVSIDGRDWGTGGLHWIAELDARDMLVACQSANSVEPNASKAKHFAAGLTVIWYSLGVVRPCPDPAAFERLMSSDRPVALVVDTSALAQGLVTWLCRLLWDRSVEIIINSVVEREVFGWADQPEFWTKKTPEFWQGRVKYRSARQVSETPFAGAVCRHPEPDEKSALMLAKRKTPNEKSPDADVLLIEQARLAIRERNPRLDVFYVTCDRNHARSALATLSSDNVLFLEAPDIHATRQDVAPALFWKPAQGLGALNKLSVRDLIWSLMMGTHRVVLENNIWSIEVVYLKHGNGSPVDWVDPHFELSVTRVAVAPSHPTLPVTVPTAPSASVGTSTAPSVAQTALSGISESSDMATTPSLGGHEQDYLLPPHEIPSPTVPGSFRPTLKLLIQGMNCAMLGEPFLRTDISEELWREAVRLLSGLGILNEEGIPILNAPVLDMIRQNDWDAVHARFKQFDCYRQAMNALNADSSNVVTERQKVQLRLARRLGQVAQLGTSRTLVIGDYPVMRSTLEEFLVTTMPTAGRDYPLLEVCTQALTRLHLTPSRFERALTRLFESGYSGVSTQTGGTASVKASEEILFFDGVEVSERRVSPASLHFGAERPTTQLRRME